MSRLTTQTAQQERLFLALRAIQDGLRQVGIDTAGERIEQRWGVDDGPHACVLPIKLEKPSESG